MISIIIKSSVSTFPHCCHIYPWLCVWLYSLGCVQIQYCDVIMGAMASQITSIAVVYSIVYSADQRKHQSSTQPAFVWGIHRWPVNSPHKGPVTRKMFLFGDVFMYWIHYGFNVVFVETRPFRPMCYQGWHYDTDTLLCYNHHVKIVDFYETAKLNFLQTIWEDRELGIYINSICFTTGTSWMRSITCSLRSEIAGSKQ